MTKEVIEKFWVIDRKENKQKLLFDSLDEARKWIKNVETGNPSLKGQFKIRGQFGEIKSVTASAGFMTGRTAKAWSPVETKRPEGKRGKTVEFTTKSGKKVSFKIK